jgi:hypothetical protein
MGEASLGLLFLASPLNQLILSPIVPNTHPTHKQMNKWQNPKKILFLYNNLLGYNTWIEMEFSYQFFSFLLTKIWPSDKLVSVVHTPHSSNSISSGAQYVTLREYISDWSFSYILFCNPTHQTETQIANRWGTTR